MKRRSFLVAAIGGPLIGCQWLSIAAGEPQNSLLQRKQSKTPDDSDAFFMADDIPSIKIFIEDAELNTLHFVSSKRTRREHAYAKSRMAWPLPRQN